jgi:diguanylate cyclase (GGDEF)-like protein/PAS domain S-box-containing protein
VKATASGRATDSAGAEVDSALEALAQAIADPDVPQPLRGVLLQAHAALLTATSEATAARDRYHALFDAVPDPVSVIAWDGTVLDLNRAGMAAYQRPRGEVVGQPIDVLNPDLPRDHLRPVRETLERDETYVIEVTNMRADGTRFPVEVHSAAFEFEGRKAIVAVARDLSGRRDAELRYRELMQTIDQGVLIRDAQGRIVSANAAAMRLFGVDGEKARLDYLLDGDRWLVVDEHGRELKAGDYPPVRALRTGQPVANTVLGYFDRERRSLTWASVTAVPQYAPGTDRVQQVLSLFTDVTALKRDSALFDRVQALAHIGGWQWDADRDQVYLTGEAMRLLGLTEPSRTMEQLLAFLREPERRRLRAALQHAVDGGPGFELDLQGFDPQGHPNWIRMVGEAEPGDPTGARLHGTLQDITQRKQTEETLRVQARTDPLTGLLNRDAVLAELHERLEDRTQPAVAVLYIDLDRFKVVNDVLGHGAGDRVLVSAARRLRAAVGTEGLIARFGGDEFMVVCNTGDDPLLPERLADAILDAFAARFEMDGEEFNITASIGIARAPADGDRPQQLIQNADVAMYDSKRRARNAWQGFTAKLAEQQSQRLQLETHLRRALENEEFHLVFQPQVELDSGRLVAVESLIRWRNGILGDMSPGHFIAHAEATGDIIGIGTWALRESCRQLRRWLDDGLAVGRIAVNVSYRQFDDDGLADRVRAVLEEYRLPGHMLELEITERVLIEDAAETLRTMDALRTLGVVLSIDDFGEGYSALNYLRRLPIHGLKLSQLFVQGVPGNESDVAICRAVAGIAQNLGLALVAEGVESESQRQFLLGLGVRTGQGFLFSPGLPAGELAARLGDPSLAWVRAEPTGGHGPASA